MNCVMHATASPTVRRAVVNELPVFLSVQSHQFQVRNGRLLDDLPGFTGMERRFEGSPRQNRVNLSQGVGAGVTFVLPADQFLECS